MEVLHLLGMRFSLWPTSRQSWPDMLAAAKHASSTGWDGVWVYDHFMGSEDAEAPTLECWSTLAALAVKVPRVRIGSLVSSNTYRHPAVLANIAVTVDHLSGGRLILGIGAGWQENEHDAYGIPLGSVRQRLDRLEEACAVLKSLFSQTRTNFDGEHYKLQDAPMEPKPLQAKLPLLIGGSGERRTLAIAARWADEWNTWGLPERLAQKGAVLDRHCAEIDRDPTEISRSANVLLHAGKGLMTEGRPSLPTHAGKLAETLGAYKQAGVSEVIIADWNLGTGTARADALDAFMETAKRFR